MRRILFILAGVMLLTCCSTEVRRVMGNAERLLDSCPEQAVAMLDSIRPEAMRQGIGGRSRYVLLQQLARHKAWMPLDVDTLLMEAVIWTNNHGTPNERLLANYLLGYGYSEQGFTTEAQHAYQQAIESADTTRNDCDFSRLAKAYAQLASMYFNKADVGLIEESASKGYMFALKAQDFVFAHDCMGIKALALCYKKEYRKSLEIYKENVSYFLSSKDTLWASNLARLVAVNYVGLNMLDSAKHYFDFFEKHNIHSDGNVDSPQFYGYYSAKGQYYMKRSMPDSAAVYFHKELALDNLTQKCAASEHLMSLYNSTCQYDSVAFYSIIYRDLTEKHDSISKSEQLQTLHFRFNFKQLEKKLEREVANTNFFILVSLLLGIIAIIGFFAYRNRCLKMEIERTDFNLQLSELKRELENRSHVENAQTHKQACPDDANQPKDATDSLPFFADWSWEKKVELAKKTNIYKSLVELYLADPKNAHMSPEQAEELYKECLYLFPDQTDLTINKRLSVKDSQVCFLNLFDFKPCEIAAFVCLSDGGVTNKRRRLCGKLFNVESAELFDGFLRNYKKQQISPEMGTFTDNPT